MGQTGVTVPTGLHLSSRLFAATSGLWKRLGNFETKVVGDELTGVSVQNPIYVTSLARAGTTIVTEMLERHPDVTSHRYSDFPNIWTPYWRNHLLQQTRREAPKAEERAHKDRIRVSNDSPEAVEEVLWMHFFPDAHNEAHNQVLNATPRNEKFDVFYRDHVRKLIAVRNATRYLAKGNYNIARLAYLRGLFPDARFVIPVRDPVDHIASLAKQHRLFCQADKEDPRVARQLALSGHFEFGPNRTFIHYGDDEQARAIRTAWDNNREVEGWARYWAQTYHHLASQLEDDPELADAVCLFRYETLCRDSESIIDQILHHCRLDAESFTDLKAEYSQRLSPPDYYQPDFSDDERGEIEKYCSPALDRLSRHLRTAV